jgi:polyferredoxin
MVRPGFAHRLAHDLTNRGPSAYALSGLLFGFYSVLYFTDWLNGPAVALGLDGKWILYGLLYTIAIVAGGVYVIRKYKQSRYQIVRTVVVMFTQVVLAFAVPLILKFFHRPEYYFSYLWPLKLDYLVPGVIFRMPLPFVLYSFLGSLLLVPVLGVFFGKRWYCSWVCGCGGLANTAGDPFRHLSSKSTNSWKFEKISIHAVLALCIALTALLFVSYGVGKDHPVLERFTGSFQALYGFLVVSLLSGVIGTGLYPVGGTRVWCRNFCPMGALLGLVQKLGRFRIAVKKDMCISCGLCTQYCEMGIDVRSYAQANESFTRASCVGCGICVEVCPRGVLRLENAPRVPGDLVQISGL